MLRSAEANGTLAETINVEDYSDREERPISLATLDVDGNGLLYTYEDGKLVVDEYVSNTTQIRTKNPRITLDKRIYATVAGDQPVGYAGGDDDGNPDYYGLQVYSNVVGSNDHEENHDPETYLRYGEGGKRISYNTRLWYEVEVINEPSEAERDTGYGRLENPIKTKESYYRANTSKNAEIAQQYKEQLTLRSQKLSESGHVAHGAFVFSDYLPSTLVYDHAWMIATVDPITGAETLLTQEEAENAGWTVIDESGDAAEWTQGAGNGEETKEKIQFVRITVIPPADMGTASNATEAYQQIADGKHPAGYMASNSSFKLKIRTRVAKVPYDEASYEDGYSKKAYFNKVFVNVDCLDGDYRAITDKAFTDYNFGGQNENSVRYYSGENTNRYVKNALTGEIDDVQLDETAKDGMTFDDGKTSEPERFAGHQDNLNQKTKAEGKTEADRYAYDSAYGFSIAIRNVVTRINTEEPLEVKKSGSIGVPNFKALQDIDLYIDEARLVEGSLGIFYLLEDLPLYSIADKTAMYKDLTKDYPGAVEVLNTMFKISTGKWYIPWDVAPYTDGKESVEATYNAYLDTDGNLVEEIYNPYRDELLQHMKVQVYYTSRTDSAEERFAIGDGFDIDAKYTSGKAKGKRIWNFLGESTLTENKVFDLEAMMTIDERQDMNQLLWVVTSDDPLKYPVPEGFMLDIDADPNSDGTPKLDRKDRKNMSDMVEIYDKKNQPIGTNTQSPNHICNYKDGVDSVYKNGILISLHSSTPNEVALTYAMHYMRAYGKYDDTGRCAVDARRRAGYQMAQKIPVLEEYISHYYFQYADDAYDDGSGVKSEGYKWIETTGSLTSLGKGRTMKYEIELLNIDQENINSSKYRDDPLDYPTVTATIPSIFTIDALDYVPYEDKADTALNTYYPEDDPNADPSATTVRGYTDKYDYPSERTLLWTWHVEGNDGGPANKETSIKLKTTDPKDSVIFSKSGDVRFVRFEFDGQLMPGDKIVIEYMARVTATNETKDSTKTTKTTAYGTNSYGTLNINPADDNEEIPYWQAVDENDYDEDKSMEDKMIVVESGEIEFEPVSETAGSKLVVTQYSSDGGSQTYPIPVMEGERYYYRNEILNKKPYRMNDDDNSYYNPFIFDILPYTDDNMIMWDGYSRVSRGSKWNTFSVLTDTSYKLYTRSGSEEVEVDPELYTVYVGPVQTRKTTIGGKVVQTIIGAGTYDADDTNGLITGDQWRATNFFYEWLISRLRGDSDADLNKNYPGVIASNPIYQSDWRDYFVPMDVVREFVNNTQTTDPDLAEEVLRGIRYIAVNFNQKHEMKGQTKYILRYEQKVPLNLPVYYGTFANDAEEDIVKSTVRRYSATNTFIRYWNSLNAIESNTSTVYVNIPEERGYIGDYIWLDANSDGLQNEIIYEIPEENRDIRTRKLPKREYNETTKTYEPAWGKDEAGNLIEDPGINRVLVQLLTPGGHLSNSEGQAVTAEAVYNERTEEWQYTVLDDETGEPYVDYEGLNITTTKGPVSYESESDYYGNKGYYILTDLAPGQYKVRFTIPEEYKEYGVTTDTVRGSKIKIYSAGDVVYENDRPVVVKGLVAETAEAITVEAAVKSQDETYTSCDIGIGLPVRYGGTVWIDEYSDDSGISYENTNGDSILQRTNPTEPVVGVGQVEITAYVKGEVDGFGNPIPATDMHGKTMVTTTDAYGNYSFDYMIPSLQKADGTYNREYYFKITKRDDPSWKPTFLTFNSVPTTDDEYNDLKADYTTGAFPAVLPKDENTGKYLYVTDPSDPFYRLYQLNTTIDLGLRKAEANIISGIVWDDTNRNGIMESTSESTQSEYGVEGIEVSLLPYIWIPEGDESEGTGRWQRVQKKENANKNDVCQWEISDVVSISYATPSEAEQTIGVLKETTSKAGRYLFRNLPIEASVEVDGVIGSYLMGYRVVIPDLPLGYTITSMHEYPLDHAEGVEYTVSNLDTDSLLHKYEDKQKGIDQTYYVLAEVVDPEDTTIHRNTKTIGVPIADEDGVRIETVTYDTDMLMPEEHADAGILTYAKANISGIIWEDLEENDVRELTEPGISGVSVILQYRLTASSCNAETQNPYLVQYDGEYASIFTYKADEFDLESFAASVGLTSDDFWYTDTLVIPKNEKAELIFSDEASADKVRRQELLKDAAKLRAEVEKTLAGSQGEFDKLASLNQDKAALESQIEGVFQEINDLQALYDKLKLEEDSVSTEIRTNKAALVSKENELAQYKKDTQDLRTEFEQWLTERETRQNTYDVRDEQITSLKETLSVKEADQAEKTAKKDQASEDKTNAETSLAEKQAEQVIAEDDLTAKRAELATAQNALRAKEDRLAEIDALLEAMGDPIEESDIAAKDDLLVEKAVVEAAIAELQTTVGTLGDAITELEGVLDELETAIAELGTTIVALQDEIDDLESALGALATAIEAVKAEKEPLEEANALLKQEIDAYTEKIDEKQSAYDEAIAKIQEMENAVKEMTDRDKTLSDKMEKLNEDIGNATIDKGKAADRLDSLQKDLERLEKSIAEQQKVVDAINLQVEDMLKEAEENEALAEVWFFAYLIYTTGGDGRYHFDDIPLFDETLYPNPKRNPNGEEISPYTFRVVVEKDSNAKYVKYQQGDDETIDSDVGYLVHTNSNAMSEEIMEELAEKFSAVRENLAVSAGFTPLEAGDGDVYSVYDGVYKLLRSSYHVKDAGMRTYDWTNRIGGTVWRDQDHDGILDAGETGIANVPVTLYCYAAYEEDERPVYYEYELLDDSAIASASNATASNATGSNATDSDATLPKSVIQIIGTAEVTYGWQKVSDVKGKQTVYTDENGRYEFVVNVTDPENPIEPYLYKVMVDKGDGEEPWSVYTRELTADAVSNDVIRTDQLLNMRTDSAAMQKIIRSANLTLDENGYIPEGTILVVNGSYDPAAFKGYVPATPANAGARIMENGRFVSGLGDAPVSPVGSGLGMESNQEKFALSYVFDILGTEKEEGIRFVDLSTKHDDLDMNAGIEQKIIPEEPDDTIVPDDPTPPDDPIPPVDPATPSKPSGGGSSGGGGTAKPKDPIIPSIESLIRIFNPKMGYEDHAYGALALIAVAVAVLWIFRKKKK